MKKFILSILAIMGAVQAHAGFTNFDKIAVGREADSNLVAVSPVAYVYMPIPLSTVKLNDGYTMMGATSISTAVYLGPVTGVTNTPSVTFPAVTGSGGSVDFTVPSNYLSGGVLELRTHVHTTITLGQVSMTADVYLGSTSAGVTSVAKVAGTAIQVPVNSVQVFNWVSLTNAAAYTPGTSVSIKLLPTGTTARQEVVAIRFKYRPFGVVNGE